MQGASRDIFLDGGIHDIITFIGILRLFSSAIVMEINQVKSTISQSICTQQESNLTLLNFPFQIQNVKDGLKYLGFRIKSDGYKIVDWTWFITKIERRLNLWSHRLLSRADRLVLIKTVLEATPVYWMSLAWIPQGIIQSIHRICHNFLWKGNKERKLYAWIKWISISIPKK